MCLIYRINQSMPFTLMIYLHSKREEMLDDTIAAKSTQSTNVAMQGWLHETESKDH